MFQNITQAYDFTDATLEILIMLAGAFILGWLLHRLFGGGGNCKHCSSRNQKDDLTVVEGIGPKISELLNQAGIYSFQTLSETSPDVLKGILERAGNRFKMHDPSTWPKQSELAAKGKWDDLEEYQEFLMGGRS